MKNSPARNLHRLVSAVDFIRVLLEDLSVDPPVTLHTACSSAYNKCVARDSRVDIHPALFVEIDPLVKTWTLPPRALIHRTSTVYFGA